MRAFFEWVGVGVAFIAWLLFLFDPGIGFYLGSATYLCYAGLIGWSAVRRRQPGWSWGALFSFLLITLPVWVGGLIWLCLGGGLFRGDGR